MPIGVLSSYFLYNILTITIWKYYKLFLPLQSKMNKNSKKYTILRFYDEQDNQLYSPHHILNIWRQSASTECQA